MMDLVGAVTNYRWLMSSCAKGWQWLWWEREAAASCVYGVREGGCQLCVCSEKRAAAGGGNGLCCRWECERVRVWVCAAGGKKETSECVIDFRFRICLAIYVCKIFFWNLIERTDRFVGSFRFWSEPNINQSVLQFVARLVFISKIEPNQTKIFRFSSVRKNRTECRRLFDRISY